MPKHVVIVASGETERRALPHLVRLSGRGIVVDGVRVPAGNKALNGPSVEALIKAAWYENFSAPPDKFVVVADADRKAPADVLRPIRDYLRGRLGGVTADIHYTCAQAHLEAWYFADVENLRAYLGRAPGSVDTSKPDEIENPKHQLTQVLLACGRSYSARVSSEIARKLDATTIAARSPSLKNFVDAVENGSGGAAPSTPVPGRREPGRSPGRIVVPATRCLASVLI